MPKRTCTSSCAWSSLALMMAHSCWQMLRGSRDSPPSRRQLMLVGRRGTGGTSTPRGAAAVVSGGASCSSSLAALSSPFTSELASLRSDAAAESRDAENSRMIWSDTCWELLMRPLWRSLSTRDWRQRSWK
uniref:Putative secreted protein n=1 Tax=Ixodes ricinus TaxID=34613 RepID=A0A6B0URQ1_IXORI